MQKLKIFLYSILRNFFIKTKLDEIYYDKRNVDIKNKKDILIDNFFKYDEFEIMNNNIFMGVHVTERIVSEAISNTEFSKIHSILKDGIGFNLESNKTSPMDIFPAFRKFISSKDLELFTEAGNNIINHYKKRAENNNKFFTMALKLIETEYENEIPIIDYLENGGYRYQINKINLKKWLYIRVGSFDEYTYIPLTDEYINNPLIISYFIINLYYSHNHLIKRKLINISNRIIKNLTFNKATKTRRYIVSSIKDYEGLIEALKTLERHSECDIDNFKNQINKYWGLMDYFSSRIDSVDTEDPRDKNRISTKRIYDDIKEIINDIVKNNKISRWINDKEREEDE